MTETYAPYQNILKKNMICWRPNLWQSNSQWHRLMEGGYSASLCGAKTAIEATLPIKPTETSSHVGRASRWLYDVISLTHHRDSTNLGISEPWGIIQEVQLDPISPRISKKWLSTKKYSLRSSYGLKLGDARSPSAIWRPKLTSETADSLISLGFSFMGRFSRLAHLDSRRLTFWLCMLKCIIHLSPISLRFSLNWLVHKIQ